jgi:DNA-directed RNA polymerase specialized sigma24 family protein
MSGTSRGTKIDLCQWFPLVYRVCGIMARYGQHPDELHSSGFMGLLHAVSHYKGDKGAAFMTYAWRCIVGRILQERECERKFRRVRVGKGGTTKRLMLFSELGPSYVSGRANVFARGELPHDTGTGQVGLAMIPKLDSRRRRVLLMRFCDGLTFEQCGVVLGVSPERVRQLQKSATCMIRGKLQEMQLAHETPLNLRELGQVVCSELVEGVK